MLNRQIHPQQTLLKSRGLDGCWNKFWPEAVDNFGNSPNSRPIEVTSSCSAVQFVNWAKGGIHDVLDSHAAELKEEIPAQLTPLRDQNDEKD